MLEDSGITVIAAWTT